MTQTAAQIARWWAATQPAVTWLKAHARLVMAVLIVLAAVLWLAEHDARVRREAELGMMRREAGTDISALRQRAETAVKEARARERAIQGLEARRAALEREASALRARLNSLRKEERVQVRPAIIPGHNHLLAGQIASPPDPARDATPLTGAKPAGESSPTAMPAEDAPELEIPDSGLGIPDASAATGNCQEQLEVQGRLVENCEERAELNRAALEAARQSARDLEKALRAKDEIAARTEERHRAELRVARGSRLGRFGRALQYVGVGVVIGMAVAL